MLPPAHRHLLKILHCQPNLQMMVAVEAAAEAAEVAGHHRLMVAAAPEGVVVHLPMAVLVAAQAEEAEHRLVVGLKAEVQEAQVVCLELELMDDRLYEVSYIHIT
jgi:hypothetical protein